MSFAYFPWYTGDYLRDTRHLSPLKHGVYLLLLAHCWDQKGPIPLDEQECAGIANCRSSDEIESLRYIVARYFVRMEDGYYNARIQKEIERAESISHARSDAGRKGYQAKAKQLLSKSQASATTPTPTPIPVQPKGKTTKAHDKRARVDLPAWLKPEDWTAYVEHRQQLRKPMTIRAQEMAIDELAKLQRDGHAPGAVIAQSLSRGWVGLFPINAGGPRGNGKAAQAERVAAMLFGKDEGVIDA